MKDLEYDVDDELYDLSDDLEYNHTNETTDKLANLYGFYRKILDYSNPDCIDDRAYILFFYAARNNIDLKATGVFSINDRVERLLELERIVYEHIFKTIKSELDLLISK